ncbi:MAG: hypothetical protein HYW15_03210 [Candidatus Giovannonibacteria bacterium]|nr:MAG: hypothetical protein HYW15_03210 [Candidatus Giovannonibacteria bacterium]
MALWYGLRNLRAYQQTKNDYSLMFFRVGLGVAIAEYFYGIPLLFLPINSYLNGLSYLLAIFPLFVGLNYALRFILKAWDYHNTEKVVAVLIPFVVLIFFLFHLHAVPMPLYFLLGLFRFVDWRVLYPYDLIWAALLFLTTVLPGIYFLAVKVETKKAFLKKILFGIVFVLGGLGGIVIVVFSGYPILLVWAFIIQFIGFSALGSIFLVDIFLKET